MKADALPRDSYTTISVQWNEDRFFCDEWEGNHLTLIGKVWYLTEGISHVSAERLAAEIDGFITVAAPPKVILEEALAAGGYILAEGAAPWVITPEDLQGVAERYGASLTPNN